MALAIIDLWIHCLACLELCPNQAIDPSSPHPRIDPNRCSECAGVYAGPPMRRHPPDRGGDPGCPGDGAQSTRIAHRPLPAV